MQPSKRFCPNCGHTSFEVAYLIDTDNLWRGNAFKCCKCGDITTHLFGRADGSYYGIDASGDVHTDLAAPKELTYSAL